MWEIYVEPNLKTQAEINKSTDRFAANADDEPMTLDRKVLEAQAMGMMFGADPLEIGKAVRKSWPVRQDEIDKIKAKLAERERAK